MDQTYEYQENPVLASKIELVIGCLTAIHPMESSLLRSLIDTAYLCGKVGGIKDLNANLRARATQSAPPASEDENRAK